MEGTVNRIRVTVRLYAELNDFVTAERRQTRFDVECADGTAVKDVIESAGVPHPEVAFLLVNGEPSPFERRLSHGHRVSAYPAFASLPVPGHLTTLRASSGDEPRFLLDVHLSRLAALLRLAGFDAPCPPGADDLSLAVISAGEGRILLTRDVALLKRSIIAQGYWVRHTAPPKQLGEVFRRFNLPLSMRPFSRCMRCNGLLRGIPRGEAEPLVPPRSFACCDEFRRCDACGRVYWRGSHVTRLLKLLDDAASGVW
jgi:uncharacterized protein with PIN domain/sulfur carrier protein ThiS